MLRAKAIRLLAVGSAVLAAAPAHAYPYITVTLFGDQPAEPYFAPASVDLPDAGTLAGKAAGGAREKFAAQQGYGSDLGTVRSDSSRQFGQPTMQSAPARSALTQGYTSQASGLVHEAPLANKEVIDALSDTRLLDEADDSAARARFDEEKTETIISAAEVSEAVREGARSARDREVDTSVQEKIDSELDQEYRLVKFDMVEMGAMGELVDKDGVLGLVEVTKFDDEDEQIVDAEGHVINVNDNDAESEIVKWRNAAPLVASATLGIAGDVGLMSDTTSDAAVQRLATLDDKGGAAVRSEQLSRSVIAAAYAGSYLFNTDSFLRQNSADNDQQRERRFSLERLLVFLRLIFTRIETYLGLALLFVGGFFYSRLSRAK